MIKIITDSTSDIPEDLLEKHQIAVVPSYVLWNGETFLDRVTISSEEFYARVENAPVRPTTSQPTTADFSRAFENAINQGAREIICVTVSSAMSGTYQSAQNAARLASVPVHVVDSKGPTMMVGWQALAAARAVEAGKSTSEALAAVEQVRKHIVLVVGMDTLSYLGKGGRIGDAIFWLGSNLSVKPLVFINRETGKVMPVALHRTHKGLVEGLYNKFRNSLSSLKNLHVAVLHGNAPDEARKLAERVRDELSPVELFTQLTGPVLGINTGPAALALCGYTEE
ncbi:MAG: DegV family protein [Chloroflexi bacterium]|jgi:DegV family protein with EDD domain|nr:DegV family protein [Anaerolineaceae bacterium]NLI45393.1 DegV family protein [Chloroflexota bacterium]HOE34376.1 DegV family protein [Anaerolineaceae bacterium]HOT26367.1 DegV family protein [Anaerolineaceae bacterium]HQH57291.1 DegV family protein [Anaerolineaceae bacterium]